jgi:hypothetical protein
MRNPGLAVIVLNEAGEAVSSPLILHQQITPARPQ